MPAPLNANELCLSKSDLPAIGPLLGEDAAYPSSSIR